MHVLDAPTCNYYERGTTSPPLYVSNTIKLQEATYDMYRPLPCVHELFFYDIRCIEESYTSSMHDICCFVLNTK